MVPFSEMAEGLVVGNGRYRMSIYSRVVGKVGLESAILYKHIL